MPTRNRMSSVTTHQIESYAELERGLLRTYGATAGGKTLTKLLGYRTQDAFRQAHQRGHLPVRTFELDGRHGRFAAVSDIAKWLWARLATAELPHPPKPESQVHSASKRGTLR